MKVIVVAIAILISTSIGFAQNDEPLAIEDEIYFEHIKSVKFHLSSLPTSYPILDLKGTGRLLLSFDDLEGDNKDYVYTITHCDKDWIPTQINELEYMTGFNEVDITNFQLSNQSKQDYTHYELLIPNNTTQLKLSGNYILSVLDEDNGNEVVLTKRFLVVEHLINITADVLPALNTEKYNTHQRVDFGIDLNKFYISDAHNELYVHILQNNRWDNALKNIKPLNVVGDVIQYNKFNTSSFPGGKEFRFFDTRDILINSERTQSIDINRHSVDVILKNDVKRGYKQYLYYRDGNGAFVPNYLSTQRNGKATSEYTHVTMILESAQPIYDHDIYAVGEFSAWKLYPENQLEYVEDLKAYVGVLLLKQGYYNYYYAAIGEDNVPNYELTEGNSFETENEYTILAYYRQLGARYDRLIGVSSVNSLKD